MTIIAHNGMKISPRTMFPLGVNYKKKLEKALSVKGGRKNIILNTGIASQTISRVLASGEGEVSTINGLKNYLDKLDAVVK